MRFSSLLLLAVLMFGAATDCSLAQPPPKREFRGAWVATVTNLDWPATRGGDPQTQKSQLITILDQLKAAGISAVIFQIRPECDALYASTIEPWSYWLTGVPGKAPSPYYDPLEFAVTEAHRRGMEIHAWFNPYRAEIRAGNYPLASNHVAVRHPSWVIRIGTLKILDPGLPQVREHVVRVVADVVRRYDVDGVHLDDYFYPYPPNQLTNQDAATFAADPRGFGNIHSWRRDNVNLLLRMIRDSLQVIKPYVKLGVSPFGVWKHNTPACVGGSTLTGYDDIYCDAIAWLQEKSVDYLAPQIYWPINCGQTDYAQIMSWWADSVAVHERHLYPGLAAYRIIGSDWSAAELSNQVKLNRGNAKVGGSVYFRAKLGINENPKGFSDSLSNNYYRFPSLHPVMPWKDVVPPYPPRAIRYDRLKENGPWALQWDLPNSAPDGDSASRYAVYRFDHRPAKSEFADARNLVSIEGVRWIVPLPPAAPWKPVYYAVTALDRNYNESDTSSIVVVAPPLPPVLASPMDGTTELPESVTVRWRSAQQTALYHLQVSADPTFSGGLFVDDSTLLDTARVVRGLAGFTAYSWRVRSSNAAGYGLFGSPFTFATGTPPSPVLINPPAATTDLPVNAEFRWTRSRAASSYRIQLSESKEFANTVADLGGLRDTALSVAELEHSRPYFWRVRATNGIGTSSWSTVNSFRTENLVSVYREEGLPDEYGLSQNSPEIYHPTTTISFDLPRGGHVRLKVHDVLGREEVSLVDDELAAGKYTVTWNASRAASGVYFYRMESGLFAMTRHMALVR